MAITVSRAQLTGWKGKYEGMKKRVHNIRKEAEHTVEKVLRTAETGGMAFGLGVLNGRHGTTEVMGMPLELLLGAGLNLAGYFGLAGKHSDHLNNLGDGALAAYLTVLGVQVGTEWQKKSLGAGSSTPPLTKGNNATREEIENIVRQAAQAT